MILSRSRFFLLLFAFCGLACFGRRTLWIATARKTTGVMSFVGHTLELQGNISSHEVIEYEAGKDTVIFNANSGMGLKPGQSVPVLYHDDDPSGAKIDTPFSLWGDTMVYALGPVLVLLVLFLTPDSLDPLIPKRSTVHLCRNKKLIQVVHL
jgi:hypothetical protein